MMIVIFTFCLICLVGFFVYAVPNEMKDDGRTPKDDEAQKKAEPTIQITVNLFDDHTVLKEICYQVPLSQADFYIPNLKNALVYNSTVFIVMEVYRDLNTNDVTINAYKAL